MERGFFFTADANGHYPGKRIYVNSDNKEIPKGTKGAREIIVTAEVVEGELYEYSVVGIGALPGAEVVKQAKLHQIEPIHKQYMLDRFGFNVDEPKNLDELVHFINPLELLPENKSFSFSNATEETKSNVTSVTGGSTMDPILNSNEQTIKTLEADNAKLLEENRNLKAQIASSEDQHKSLSAKDEEIVKLQEENKALDQKLSDQGIINEEYHKELSEAKQHAKEMWIRMKGSNPSLEEFNKTIEDINKLSTVKTLARNWRFQGDSVLGVSGRARNEMAPNAIVTPDPYVYDAADYR